MISQAEADNGPIVAVLRKREKAHRTCAATLKQLRAPLLTCWPVLTEVAWLLRNEPERIKSLGGLIRTGSFHLVELDEAAFHWVIAFLDRYSSVGAQLADAALMYIAECGHLGEQVAMNLVVVKQVRVGAEEADLHERTRDEAFRVGMEQ